MPGQLGTFQHMTELEEMRRATLEARAKNRAKNDSKTKAMNEARQNKSLRRINRAIQAGASTEKEFKAMGKRLDDLNK